MTLDAADGELVVQAVPEGAGRVPRGSARRTFGLALPKARPARSSSAPRAPYRRAAVREVPRPAGWKEYTATNKTYKVWLPEKG